MEKAHQGSQKRRRLTRVAGTILLLLAFLCMFLFFFFQFRGAALQSIAAASESFGHYVDSVLTLSNANVRTSAMQVFYTSSIRKLRTGVELTGPERTIGHRDLGNFVSSSIFIDNIMIYNRNLDMVFTSESGYSSAPSEEFHDREAADILRLPPQQPYLAPFRRESRGVSYYSFLFYSDAPAGYSAMLLDINADWYETQLLGRLTPERHVIVDAQGAPVIRREGTPELPDWKDFQKALSAGPESGYVLSERSLLLSSCWVYQKLGNTGWYYLEHFELENDVPGLARLQRVVLAVFALVCAAILALFIYFFFTLLPPLLHISQALTAVGSGEKNVTEKFDELLSSHNAYQSARKLRELQAGVLPADMPLPVAFVAAPAAGEEIVAAARGRDAVEEPILARSELGEVVILPGCISKKRNLILGKLRGLALPTPVFFSVPCYSSEQLLDAFDALEELRQLAFLYPNQTILLQELLSECSESSGLQRETVSAMESSLKKGQPDVAHAQWLLLFNSIRKDRLRDFRFAIHYVDRMLSVLEGEYGVGPARPVDGCLTDLEALHGYFDERFRSITEAVNAQQQQAADALTRSAWERIYACYQDENCCTQMIAEQLDVSPGHLNRQFRLGAGMSVGDAIQHVRIDKVCKLLTQSELPVEQIARQVGYSNTKYFFVLFKKHIGKTPAQFRAELGARLPQNMATEVI